MNLIFLLVCVGICWTCALIAEGLDVRAASDGHPPGFRVIVKFVRAFFYFCMYTALGFFLLYSLDAALVVWFPEHTR